MITTTYQDAAAFLHKTQTTLEANEAANNLMLGICFRLRDFPDRMKIGPSQAAKAFAETWAKVSGVGYQAGMRQRIYALQQVIQPKPISGKLRLAAEDDLDLVTKWLRGFQEDAFGEGDIVLVRETAETKIAHQEIYLWEDGEPVSMAAKTRPMTKGISVSLVYTPPELRGRGYATACVASLSQLLLDSGWQFCSLFTDLSNPTSNSIYQKIGYKPVCNFNEYLFMS